MLRVRCLGAEALDALVPQWTALWVQDAKASPFQSPAWLVPWWRHFGSGEARLIAARDSDGALVGLLPLYRHDEPGCRKLLPLGIAVSDYLDALADPDCPEVAEALWNAIDRIEDWDEFHFPDLPPDAVLLSGPHDIIESVPCPVLALPASFEAPGDAIPRKTLRDLRQARTRAEAIGDVRFERADAASLDAAMRDYFALHERRWRRRGESGVLADPAVRKFQIDAARSLLQAGLLRLYTLRVAGEPLAIYFGLLRGSRAYAYLGGFDPEKPRLSPGAQILGHAIQEAMREGVREFHFLRGGEAYKYAWGAVDRWNRSITVRRR